MSLMVKNIAVAIDGQPLFEPLSFTVPRGKVFSIMGPSGCGKSTLLNYICGTLEDVFTGQGDIFLENRLLNHIPAHKRGIGLQFQDHLLFPHMSVGDNLAFAIPRKYHRRERHQLIRQSLEDCGLAGYEHYHPDRLSGGQKARVSLIRTLLSEPGLLLLDEPFSKLDSELRQQFRMFVFNQIVQRNIPALMVTHDPQDIFDYQLLHQFS